MKLSVVIVSYNVKHYLYQCLDSLFRAIEGIDAEVFVVDNHSKDGSVEFLRAHFPAVRFIASNHNLGFSRANNIAIRQSSGDYVLLLNPDTIVGEEVVEQCVAFLDGHDDAGATGVCMLKVDGSPANESRRGLPTPMVAFYKMTGLCRCFPRSRRFGKYYMSYLPWDEPAAIEVISGAYFMVRRRALEEVGLLDEDFFMYGEDIDLSCRILKGGYQNWYLPSRILHYKGESTQKSSFRYVHVFYDAMLIFFRKHYSHLSLLLSLPIKTAIYLKAGVELVRMFADRVRMMLGFSSGRRMEPDYVFIGREEAMDECRSIAQGKALSAVYVVADGQTLPEGHLSQQVRRLMEQTTASKKVVVYDTAAYSYRQILDNFSECPMDRVTLGIYHGEIKTIITGEEVLA